MHGGSAELQRGTFDTTTLEFSTEVAVQHFWAEKHIWRDKAFNHSTGTTSTVVVRIVPQMFTFKQTPPKLGD